MKKIATSISIVALLLCMANTTVSAQRITVTLAGNGIAGFNGDGNPGYLTNISSPYDVCMDAEQNIYFSDVGSGRIRKISAQNGIVSTIAGGGVVTLDGVPATSASLAPGNICIDAAGNLYVVASSRKIRRIDAATNIITTVAGTGIGGFSGDGGAATLASFNNISGLCIDNLNNIYVVDQGNNRVRKISATTGIITTIAGTSAPGYTGDGGPSTSAQLSSPAAICVNSSGDVFFGDQDEIMYPAHSVIREINSVTNVISTFAGALTGTTLFGVPATSAMLGNVTGICVDDTGNIYFNEISCSCRKIDIASDTMSAVGGNFLIQGYSDDVNSLLANMNNPYGLCADPSGNIYIADKLNQRIRKLIQLTHTPSFAYGKGQLISPCPGYLFSVDTQMTITDIDAGQTETWTVITPPLHGSLSGFPATGTSLGTSSTITTSGASYITPGYFVGTDSFRVKVSDGALSDTVTVYISPKLPETGSISGASAVCTGAMASLTETVYGGMWSVSNSNAIVGSSSGSVTGITAGIDTITYSSGTSCVLATTKIMTINPTPAAGTIIGDDGVCTETMITLTDTASGGTWSSLSPSIATIGTSSGIVTGLSFGSTLIAYTVSNAWCSSVVTKMLTVDSLPPEAGTISGPGSLCIGSAVAFVDGIGGIWSVSNSNAIVSDSGIVMGILTGSDTIFYNLSNGCGSATAATVVTMYAIPGTGPISGMTSLCAGSAITLTDSIAGGIWSVSNSDASVSGSGIVSGIFAGSDSVLYTVSNVCGTATSATEIIINPLPESGTISSGGGSICIGATIALTDTVTGGIWSANNGYAVVSGTGIVSGASVGIDTIVYSVSNACGIATATATVTINPIPFVGAIMSDTSVCIDSTITLVDSVAGGIWTQVNSHAMISSSGLFMGLSEGIDTVVYSVYNSCGSASAYQQITINDCDKTATTQTLVPSINVFPNPASTFLNIKWGNAIGNGNIIITDITGQVVLRADLISNGNNSGEMQVNLSNLKDGVYLLAIITGSDYFTDKLVITK